MCLSKLKGVFHETRKTDVIENRTSSASVLKSPYLLET